MNIGIYIYDQAEVLDFSGPFEVFSTANRLIETTNKFNVFLIAEQEKPVIARGEYSVNPHYNFHNHPEIDLLIVAGGVHTAEMTKANVIKWVSRVAKKAQLVTSVCTGAFILAEAGLLRNRKVTTHWEDIDDLKRAYADLTVIEAQRWVDEGSIVTSGGISAGIDMSLHLVARVISPELAAKTAKQMEFDWRQNAEAH